MGLLWKLYIKVSEAELQGVLVDRLKLAMVKKSIEVGILVPANGMVLRHETDGQVLPELHIQHAQGVLRIPDAPRKNQVSDQHAFCGRFQVPDACVQEAFLTNHLFDGRKGHLRVIPASGESLG